MTTNSLIAILSIIALLGAIVVAIYLIIVLYRANRILSKLDHLSDTFRSFVTDVVPALINISTVTTAVHGVLKAFVEHHKSAKK